ncbi:MAG: zinc-ribbon domain-containing protein [Oscillospiraceae bacterium]|nr:zinc-ribbon domain-containing protein [Oscillospiraceae bacterium]
MANFCKHCGTKLAEGAAFCPSCGAKVEAEVRKSFCRSCGAELAEGVRFCKKCGTPVAAAAPAAQAAPTAPASVPRSFCAVCGHELQPGDRFCLACGASAASAAPAQPVNPAAQAAYTHQNVQTTYASDRARRAQQTYQQPVYQQSAQPYAQVPAAEKPKKKRGFFLLFLLIWAGLLYLGYRWVPEAVKDARLPIVPAVSEEEITEEQREEYAELGTVIPAGDPDQLEEEEPASFAHEAYAWLYGTLAVGEEGDE